MRTLKELALEAIQIQDTCNPLGLSERYAKVLQELRDTLKKLKLPSDTLAISRHPINRMWTSKLHDLAGMDFGNGDKFGEAYDWCKSLLEKEPGNAKD